MITIPNNPNRFIGALNTHGENLLPLLALGTTDAKDVNVLLMTWVPPCHMHFFLGCRLFPRAAAVTGVMAVKNNRTCAQAQAFVDWLMALTYPRNAMLPVPWVLFTTKVTAPVRHHQFTAWCQLCLEQILPDLAGATSDVCGATCQIATLMGDLLNVQCGQHSDTQAA